MKPTTKTTLYLPEQLHSEVKIEAAKRRIPMTKLIIQAIEHELARLKSKQIHHAVDSEPEGDIREVGRT